MALIIEGDGKPLPIKALHIDEGDNLCSFAHVTGFFLINLRYLCNFIGIVNHKKKVMSSMKFILTKDFKCEIIRSTINLAVSAVCVSL